jgi:hypothetical protein
VEELRKAVRAAEQNHQAAMHALTEERQRSLELQVKISRQVCMELKHKIPVEMEIAWMPPFNRTCATLCLMICICSAQSMSSGSRARLLEVEEPKMVQMKK